jgi:hypothetical protein
LETALASGDQEVLTVIPLHVEEAQLAQIPADQLSESLRPLLADWNVLALSESGWDHDTRHLIEAIAAATGLPVNPELEVLMALMSGAQQGLSMKRERKEYLYRGLKLLSALKQAGKLHANPDWFDNALRSLN